MLRTCFRCRTFSAKCSYKYYILLYVSNNWETMMFQADDDVQSGIVMDFGGFHQKSELNPNLGAWERGTKYPAFMVYIILSCLGNHWAHPSSNSPINPPRNKDNHRSTGQTADPPTHRFWVMSSLEAPNWAAWLESFFSLQNTNLGPSKHVFQKSWNNFRFQSDQQKIRKKREKPQKKG